MTSIVITNPMNATKESWKGYDARTSAIKNPEKASWFINHLPSSGHVLDFGAGTGKWSKLIAKELPDIHIDVLDIRTNELLQHYDIPQIRRHISSSFEQFTPTLNYYDGIWARSSVFFIQASELKRAISALSASLKPAGILEFDMIESTHDHSHLFMFHPTPAASMQPLLLEANLTIVDMIKGSGKFGRDRIELPNYTVRCRKLSQG